MNKTSCDVLVVGGGVAGTLAAVAAARNGARTVLIEKESCLGGIGYAGMFQYICGLYLNGEPVPAGTLNSGIVREVVDRLGNASPKKTVRRLGRVFVLPYAREGLRSVLTVLTENERNLSVLLDCSAESVEVEVRSGTIERVMVTQRGSVQGIEPALVVDCSGDGAAASLAGAEFDLAPAEKRQLAGFTLHVKGLTALDEMLAIKVPYYLLQAVKEGALAPPLRFTTFSPGDAPDEGYFKMSVADDASGGREERARSDAEALHHYLAAAVPAFRNSYIVKTSPRVLDREGKRIRGEYTLTEEDVLAGRKFPDGVVRNSWPVELWDREKGTIYRYLPPGEYYEIPFRCLLVKHFANLITAGRCISVTSGALGSTRVMGTCMSLGEQAGKAAAYRVRNGAYPGDMKQFSGQDR